MKRRIIATFLFLAIVGLVGSAVFYYDYKVKLDENELAANKLQNKNPIKEGMYKTISTYEEFRSHIEREENTFVVLGQTNCHFCELFQPVLKSVSEEYGFEVLYVDLKALSKEDMSEVLNSGLKIPASCTDSGQESDLSKGFSTPLSLFVNSGESYDCLRGYVQKNTLVTKLKDKGYIE